jgi:hypothetical protein
VVKFRLKVQQVEQVCLFELTWGHGQQLSATVPYPANLTSLFQDWQRVYLQFYKTVSLTIAPPPKPDIHPPLRGRAAESGGISATPVDWHARLVEAEAKLLYEFHRWLRSSELFDIRAQIAQASQDSKTGDVQERSPVQLFLTCSPLSLARLPWEAWEIGTEFAAGGSIRIVRSPTNIRSAASAPRRSSRSRARILAILGDDTGLNFQTDQDAVRSLSGVADIHFVGWQPGQSAAELKTQIGQAIADEQGWDVLFFAGHSNETEITGGELAIAPHVSMTIHELTPQLAVAKERGLQFAIFNSCSGLNIAESLIDLGLSQVAVMREPIHNRVAEEFLLRFLQALAAHHDVQDSLLAACQFLKLEKNLTYPSAHLIPSLFFHPNAVPFQIQPSGWKQQVKQWLPTRIEAIALTLCLLLGVIPQVQDILLSRRLWMQAIYRDLTGQLPPPTRPPVALVQIDDKSIRLSGMSQPTPIDRSYLASLVAQLSSLNANVVGIDYLLDRQQPGNDATLGHAVRQAVGQNNTWFVFGALRSSGQEVGIGEATGIASHNWSLQGYINALPTHIRLPGPTEDCRQTCPFAYLLSLVYTAHQRMPPDDLAQPQLTSQTDLRTQFINQLSSGRLPEPELQQLVRSRLLPISVWANDTLYQPWLRPIIDFSIPPERVYDRIAAWGLLDTRFASSFSQVSKQVVIIASGGYPEAGVNQGTDYFPLPPALNYWRDRSKPPQPVVDTPLNSSIRPNVLTGAESQAYMVYQLLNRRLVVPIPDIWMIGLVAIVGKGTQLWLKRQQQLRLHHDPLKIVAVLTGGTLLYGVVGLQLYISAAVLCPWLLPTAMTWVYGLSVFKRK